MSQSAHIWMHETLHPSYRQSFEVKKMLCDKVSKFQHIQIFESKSHGRVLMLDGVVQLTERDEYIYHEMLVHVPLLTHPKPKKVLIIGGGDGGAVQRVLMHTGVKVTLVEIDPEIIALSKKYLQSVSAGTFDDARLTIINEDGAHFIHTTSEVFDIIITDRGDPIGPVQSLFQKEYYENCKKHLAKDGILVSLTGVPFMQGKELCESFKNLKSLFKINTCYLVPVPTYIGGPLAITWSSQTLSPQKIDTKKITRRFKKLRTKYYNPQIHVAAFALPEDIKRLIS